MECLTRLLCLYKEQTTLQSRSGQNLTNQHASESRSSQKTAFTESISPATNVPITESHNDVADDSLNRCDSKKRTGGSKCRLLGPLCGRKSEGETDVMCEGLDRLKLEEADCDKTICDNDRGGVLEDTHKQEVDNRNQEVDNQKQEVNSFQCCQCRQSEFVAIYLLYNLGSPDALALGYEMKPLLK